MSLWALRVIYGPAKVLPVDSDLRTIQICTGSVGNWASVTVFLFVHIMIPSTAVKLAFWVRKKVICSALSRGKD